MKRFTLPILLILSFAVHSQNQEALQREIDQQLWKPFQTAFEQLDSQALNALYAPEVVRVTPAGIDTQNRFKQANVERLNRHRESDTDLQLDFWFDSRHTDATTSYEVGFYRMVLGNAQGSQEIYGQFHIVLKKIEGTWKIVQDWDTDSILGKQITKKDFEKKAPLSFD